MTPCFSRLMPLLTVCALLGLLPLCTACGPSTPTHYYMLDSGETPLAADRLPPTVLRIAQVGIPGYLDRQGLVSRRPDSHRLRVDNFDIWAEPLDQGIHRVLREVLWPRLLPCGITVDCGNGNDGWNSVLVLNILRLDGAPGQTAHLEARWSVQDTASRILAGGNYADSLDCPAQTGGDGSPSALVSAQSQLLQRMGRALAPQIARAVAPARGVVAR